MSTATIVIMAKECVPGRVKTRLHPPFTLVEAAAVAQASLDDTVATVRRVDARRVLCVQGEIAVVDGFAQAPQTAGGLDERIAAAIDGIAGRVLLIGMDTPQVDPALLQRMIDDWPDNADAWFGPAADGGFWLLGLRGQDELRERGFTAPRGDLVRGVPMSVPETGARQRERLESARLRVAEAPMLTDIDDVDALRRVVSLLPRASRTSQATAALGPTGSRA